jgi:hypothetical protein
VSWKSTIGLDQVDLGIHAGVTALAILAIRASGGPIEAGLLCGGFSLVVLGFRRYFALRALRTPGLSSGEMAAERLAELEQRMEELEAAQARVAELEERLDFAERLLAAKDHQLALPPERAGSTESR